MLSYFGLIPHGHLLDVPNAMLGTIYYAYLLFFANMRNTPSAVTSLMIGVAFSSSVFLAYQLSFVVRELCILCWSTHVINTTLLYKHVVQAKKLKTN
jgi:vitamin-K-epoxide reductase (warfarin-sensitive)